MKRRSSLTAVLLALAVLAGACSNSSEPSASDPTTAGSDDAGTGTTAPGDEGSDAEPPSDFNKAFVEGEPAEGGSITIGVEATVASLAPAGALTQVSDIDIALALYDPLVAFDDEGGYAPSLATEWSNSDDLKTWTITVRDDVTFNDGTPFDADAVVKHFARLKDPATNCVCATEVALISSVEAPDPTTVVFTLAEPNAFLIDSLADVIG